jgi:hypothetical protein
MASSRILGDKIADFNELALFRICFLEKWIVETVIPKTNKTLDKPMDLQEFYVWLGCIFFSPVSKASKIVTSGGHRSQ